MLSAHRRGFTREIMRLAHICMYVHHAEGIFDCRGKRRCSPLTILKDDRERDTPEIETGLRARI